MNKRSILALFGTGLSLVTLLFSLWQFDVICCGKVWGTCEGNIGTYQYYISQGWNSFSVVPFQCSELWKTNIGIAYDTLLSLAVASWFMLLVSLFGLFYFERLKVKKLEKKLGCKIE